MVGVIGKSLVQRTRGIQGHQIDVTNNVRRSTSAQSLHYGSVSRSRSENASKTDATSHARDVSRESSGGSQTLIVSLAAISFPSTS